MGIVVVEPHAVSKIKDKVRDKIKNAGLNFMAASVGHQNGIKIAL
jgi:hypothetical protein